MTLSIYDFDVNILLIISSLNDLELISLHSTAAIIST